MPKSFGLVKSLYDYEFTPHSSSIPLGTFLFCFKEKYSQIMEHRLKMF